MAEHGIGYLDGEPVYVLELERAVEVEGCRWQGLRAFMLEGDHTLYKVLGYAAQIATWAREHRFCGRCGRAMTAGARGAGDVLLALRVAQLSAYFTEHDRADHPRR
jgi:NADH pyrophosphatase NudC (nudix superfamily)